MTASDDAGSGSKQGAVTTAARLLTEVLSPAVLVAIVLLAVAWHAADTPAQALLWGAIAAAAASLIPISFIVAGVKRGRWTDKHVTVRSQRTLPLLVCLGSTGAGTLVLAASGAPRELLALITCMVTALVIAAVVTLTGRWKISIHALVAAGTAAALVVINGPVLLLTWPIAVAVAWSRVHLRDHTCAQVVAGAAVGACATGFLFPVLA